MLAACCASTALLLLTSAPAAPRHHSVVLGKPRLVKLQSDSGKTRDEEIRGLVIDDHVREYTSGPYHDVTDHLFVVRRAYHVNDALPQERTTAPRWAWRLGGWISVDRSTGHIAQLNLPLFDAETSEA